MYTVDVDIWRERHIKDESPSAPLDVLGTVYRRRTTRDGLVRAYQSQSVATNVGENSGAQGEQSCSVGSLAEAIDNGTTAIGANATARVKAGTAVGESARAGKRGATVTGARAHADGIHATLMGHAGNITGDDDIGIGVNVVVTHDNCIIIGNNQASTSDDQIIIATDGNTNFRVDSDGKVYVNSIQVGELITPNSAETNTVNVTASNVSGTWSSWNEAFASTASRAVRVLLGIISGRITTAGRFEFQVATGGAGSETNLLGSHTFYIGVPANEDVAANFEFTFDIAAGTRISVRNRQVGAVAVSTPSVITVTMLEVV